MKEARGGLAWDGCQLQGAHQEERSTAAQKGLPASFYSWPGQGETEGHDAWLPHSSIRNSPGRGQDEDVSGSASVVGATAKGCLQGESGSAAQDEGCPWRCSEAQGQAQEPLGPFTFTASYGKGSSPHRARSWHRGHRQRDTATSAQHRMRPHQGRPTGQGSPELPADLHALRHTTMPGSGLSASHLSSFPSPTAGPTAEGHHSHKMKPYSCSPPSRCPAGLDSTAPARHMPLSPSLPFPSPPLQMSPATQAQLSLLLHAISWDCPDLQRKLGLVHVTAPHTDPQASLTHGGSAQGLRPAQL